MSMVNDDMAVHFNTSSRPVDTAVIRIPFKSGQDETRSS